MVLAELWPLAKNRPHEGDYWSGVDVGLNACEQIALWSLGKQKIIKG